MKLASGEREAGLSEEGHKCSEGPRWVRSFHDYAGESRELLGGKGYGLAEMTSLGLPIPEGFTITTEACLAYFRGDNQVPEQLWGEVELAIRALESRRGQRLGDPDSPLLVSVRSGAAVSMPGMMDTVLQSRHQPRSRRGHRASQRQSRVRLRPVSSVHPDVQRSGKWALILPTSPT